MALTLDMRLTSMTPILMLTAMAETEARIQGLRAGADDYLGKPFEIREELLLRIRSILRRTQSDQNGKAISPTHHDKRFYPWRCHF